MIIEHHYLGVFQFFLSIMSCIGRANIEKYEKASEGERIRHAHLRPHTKREVVVVEELNLTSVEQYDPIGYTISNTTEKDETILDPPIILLDNSTDGYARNIEDGTPFPW